jgi:hypothetical protein
MLVMLIAVTGKLNESGIACRKLPAGGFNMPHSDVYLETVRLFQIAKRRAGEGG